MATEENKKQSHDAKIDAIKQIIFGENIDDYNKRFDSVQASITDLKSDLDSKITALEIELKNMLSALGTKQDEALNTLSAQIRKELVDLNNKKIDKATLGKMLISIGEKLQA